MHHIDPAKPVEVLADELRAMDSGQGCFALSLAMAKAVADGDGEAVIAMAVAYCLWQGTGISEATGMSFVHLLRCQGVPSAQKLRDLRSLSH